MKPGPTRTSAGLPKTGIPETGLPDTTRCFGCGVLYSRRVSGVTLYIRRPVYQRGKNGRARRQWYAIARLCHRCVKDRAIPTVHWEEE